MRFATASLLGLFLSSLGSCLALGEPQDRPAFERWFTGATLRLDYHHTGRSGEEHIAPAEVRLEGAWPGSRTSLVDPYDRGLYRFEVHDAASGALLFARGFCSVFGEWETTGEAKQLWRAFEESQRFPEPKASVHLVLSKRQAAGGWKEIFATDVDPQSRFVDRSPIGTRAEVLPLVENGPSATKVDLLILADGYTAAEKPKFVADATRLSNVLFATQPYQRHKADFNVRLVFAPTPQSGISNPRKGVWHESVFGLSFNAFDSDRYVLTFADRELREIAAQAPYDALILLFNDRKYGGGGIYNLWCTCAADTEPAPYIFVHEFGHSFAGLADEYYTSQVSYEDLQPAGVEPWEPNVTALLDKQHLKWGGLVQSGTPLPTPWRQAEYDAADLAYQKKRKQLIDERASEEASEALMREVKLSSGAFLAAERWAGKVGAFEGAMYQAKGLYRPEADCIMFTRNPTTFCRVCEGAIEQTIQAHLR